MFILVVESESVGERGRWGLGACLMEIEALMGTYLFVKLVDC
jgi:hypothetical protein